MPAPKGNKNAVKVNPRAEQIKIRCLPGTKNKLKQLAESKKLSMTEVIENFIDREFRDIVKK